MTRTETTDPLVAIWRQILVDPKKSWVLFEHGTCVILVNPAEDLSQQATEILSEYGPVYAGTPAGDFNTLQLDEGPVKGWVVTGHHPDVLNYVAPKGDGEGEQPADMVVGLLGRGNRDQDGKELRILHVQDNRGTA